MPGFSCELFLDFDVPKEFKEEVTTTIYERGTRRAVGAAVFCTYGPVELYVDLDALQRVGAESGQDIVRRLGGRDYFLCYKDPKGIEEKGVKIHTT